MTDLIYALLFFSGMVACAALLLKLGELASRFFRIRGLALYVLAAAGLLLSGLGWEGYAQGQVTLWQALCGTIFLGGLPLWTALWLIAPDLLRIAFSHAARLCRAPKHRA